MSLALSAYSAMPWWVQNGLLSAYGLRVRWLRYGRVQQKLLEDLRRSQWLDAETLRSMQLKALKETIARAHAEVPFYRNQAFARPTLRSLEELREFPILTKDEVKAAGRRLTSEQSGRRLLEIHTGGTTGKPLTVYCDRETLQRNYAFFARLREWAGISPRARVATFAGRRIVPADAGPPFWRHNAAAHTLLLSSYHISPRSVDSYIDALAKFKADLIDSYPSSLVPLADRLLETGTTSIRPRAIITSSETLVAEIKHRFEQAFGCPTFDHYGSAEMVALVTMCEQGKYHPNPEFGIVEVLRNGEPVRPGEQGEIVATGFINPVMPLIRYSMGDSAVLGESGCACGRNFPVLERIEGRMDDVLITPDGRHVGRLDPIFKAVASLYETRIVQDRLDHVTVEAVIRGELPAAEERVLLEELQARLGSAMLIDFVRVPAIERTAGGKLRAVVNLTTKPPVAASEFERET